MQLLRVGHPGKERPCLVAPDASVRDASRWVTDWAGSVLDPSFLHALRDKALLEWPSLPKVDVSSERIGPAVQPRQIISIGLNYRRHAQEAGMDLPLEPIVAAKSVLAVAGPNDDLIIPPGCRKVDWEVELGVVIGRRAQYLSDRSAAMECIAGYCTANDLSDREWLLERGGQWLKGKSFENFAPLGPYLLTADTIKDPGRLRLLCKVNGRVMQDDSTSDMIFDVGYLVHYLSQCMILEAGDVILTGSPGGIALGRPDKPYLRDQDIVEAEIVGLGTQRQRCRHYASPHA